MAELVPYGNVVTVEKIDGIPFETVKGDLAKCGLCGAVVDVGGEIKAHIAEHKYGELED
jgi:hypothetical protein